MLRRKRVWISLVLAGGLSYTLWQGWNTQSMFHIQGQTMGHIRYHIRYVSTQAQTTKSEIDSLLQIFNQVFSTYEPTSQISQFNQQDTLTFQSHWWLSLLKESQRVHRESHGAFDPTIAPLLEVYGFTSNESSFQGSTASSQEKQIRTTDFISAARALFRTLFLQARHLKSRLTLTVRRL